MTVILMVEDEPSILDAECELLTDLGYKMYAAGSEAEAMKIADSGVPIDILFADIRLGSGNGVHLAHRLIKERPSTRVVLATGYADAADGARDGNWPIVMKPYTVKALVEIFERVLQ